MWMLRLPGGSTVPSVSPFLLGPDADAVLCAGSSPGRPHHLLLRGFLLVMQHVHPFLSLALHLAQHRLLVAPARGPGGLRRAHRRRPRRRPVSLLLLPLIIWMLACKRMVGRQLESEFQLKIRESDDELKVESRRTDRHGRISYHFGRGALLVWC